MKRFRWKIPRCDENEYLRARDPRGQPGRGHVIGALVKLEMPELAPKLVDKRGRT